MSLLDLPIAALDGTPTTLGAITGGGPALLVNVASKCGLTPQYTALEVMHEKYADRGFTVVGFPCNQFGEQEPGSAEEIKTFCSMSYGVTFPLTEKVEVNGPGRHPVFAQLTAAAVGPAAGGDVTWNFEKFLLDRTGQVVARFRPQVTPDDPEVVEAVESLL